MVFYISKSINRKQTMSSNSNSNVSLPLPLTSLLKIFHSFLHKVRIESNKFPYSGALYDVCSDGFPLYWMV